MQSIFKGVPLLGQLFSGPPVGIGLLSAGIILAIMVIPFIASVMRDVFEVTPPMLKESAYALGSTTWEVVWKVVLPYTKTGVVGGIMLGLGRALGETMAVTFVIGNFNQLNSLSLFEAANSITSALANEFAEAAPGLHQASLIYLGLVLFVITFVVLSISRCCCAPAPQIQVMSANSEPRSSCCAQQLSAQERERMSLSADAALVLDSARRAPGLHARRKRVNVVALTLALAAMASASSGWSGSWSRPSASASAA